LLDLDC
jgi:hypothetical protein